MTLFTVDSQNVFGKSVLEAGTYNVKILSDSEYKLTKKQDDMAVLNYEVEDGQYRGGKILYDNIVWQHDDVEASQKRFNTLLTAIGVADGTPIASIQQLVNAVKGKVLNIRVDWVRNETNGKWYLNVKGYQKFDTEGSKSNGVKRPDENQSTQKTNQGQTNNFQQQSLSGVDPMNSNRSFANGGFNGAMNISDDDRSSVDR